MRILLTAIIPMVMAAPAWAVYYNPADHTYDETFYVRDDGDCANNGNGLASNCAASPGASGAFRGYYNAAFSLTDETVGSIDPGDLVYVCGTHIDGYIHGPTDASGLGSGTAAKHVTVSFDCPGNRGFSDASAAGNYGFLTYAAYVDVINPRAIGGAINTMSITNSTGSQTAQQHVTVYGGRMSYNLINLSKCVNLIGQYITIDGMEVDHCYDDGIWMKGKHNTLRHNYIHDVSFGTITGDCMQISDHMDDTLWEYNYCDHRNVDSKYCGVLTTDTDGGTVTVRYNWCLKRNTDTVGDGFRSDTNTYFYGNWVFGGTMGIHCNTASDEFCYVYGNYFEGQTLAGVRTESGTVNVCNNTFRNQILVGHRMVGTAATQRSCNNIFANMPTGIKKDTNNTPLDDHNEFHDISGNALLVNATPTTPGTGSLLTSDPAFHDGTSLLNSNSPAIGAGVFWDAMCGYQFEMTCDPTAPDLGAYKYQPAGILRVF